MISPLPSKRSQTTAFWLSVVTLVLALLAAALTILPGPLYRAHWVSLGGAFQSIRDGAYLGVLVLVFGIIAVIASVYAHRTKLLLGNLVLAIAGVMCFGVPFFWLLKAESVPPIHDITTDPLHPPAFTALMPILRQVPNSPIYGDGSASARKMERGAVVAFVTRGSGRTNRHAAEVVRSCAHWDARCLFTVQEVYYPMIRPLILDHESRSEAYAKTLELVRQRHWRVAFASPGTGRIEAVARTPWFGFKDDVAIRIQKVPGGVRIDMRSESRIGLSDIGRNASRVEHFMRQLKARLRSR
jgi:uncharacterized protein (DUF1499 family)